MELSFETLGDISEGGGGPTAEYSWGGGPGTKFELKVVSTSGGGILGLPLGTILLGGTLGAEIVSAEFGPTFGGFRANLGGFDMKHETLLKAFFGTEEVPEEFIFVNAHLIIENAVFEANGGFTADVREADILNFVPAPGSSLLALMGLAALAAVRRRRKS